MAEHPNATLVRRLYDAFSSADMETVLSLFADDIVYHVPGRNLLSGDYRGKDQWLGLIGRVAELTGGTFRVDVHDVLGNDEHAVALTRQTAARNGKSLDTEEAHVFHFRDGKIAEMWQMYTRQANVDDVMS